MMTLCISVTLYIDYHNIFVVQNERIYKQVYHTRQDHVYVETNCDNKFSKGEPQIWRPNLEDRLRNFTSGGKRV